MNWRAIGQQVVGTAHIHGGKGCEDAVAYNIVPTVEGEVLICCTSDGAGSAHYAAQASQYVTQRTVEILSGYAQNTILVRDVEVLMIVEELYEELKNKSQVLGCDINEFSCTFLGCYLQQQRAVFFQIGDGAIVREGGDRMFTPVWWPHNGEYSNTTAFLVDDNTFPYLKITVLEESIREVAIFTDGLQNLVLNTEATSVHQPFFEDLFQWLRKAKTDRDVQILEQKLGGYLAGETINRRTDDDKTLFLATRYSE